MRMNHYQVGKDAVLLEKVEGLNVVYDFVGKINHLSLVQLRLHCIHS